MLQLKSYRVGARDQTPGCNWSWTDGMWKQSSPNNNSLLTFPKGLGIALVAAQKAGVSVTLVDTSQASIDKGLKFAGRTIISLRTFTLHLTFLLQTSF